MPDYFRFYKLNPPPSLHQEKNSTKLYKCKNFNIIQVLREICIASFHYIQNLKVIIFRKCKSWRVLYWFAGKLCLNISSQLLIEHLNTIKTYGRFLLIRKFLMCSYNCVDFLISTDQPPSEQPNNRFLPGPRSIQGGSPPVPPARKPGNLQIPMNKSEEAPPLPPDRKRQMPVSPPNLFISKPLLPHTEVETASTPAPLIPLLKSSPLIPHTGVKTTPTTAYSSSTSVLHEVPPPVPKRGGRRSRSGPGRGACYGRISGHTSTSH